MIKINHIATKFCLACLSIFCLYAAIFFSTQKGVKELYANRFALVDEIGNNYIFRGSMPLVLKNDELVFAREELTSFFNEILLKKNGKQLQDYYLIDVSFVDLDQYYSTKKERDFFNKHPDYGTLVNVSTISPSLLLSQISDSNLIINTLTKSYKIWITGTLIKLHEIASTQMDKPVVIYLHCDSGRDRTGFMTANYKLLFKNLNLREVRSQNVTEAGRKSVAIYDKMIGSYCSYVQKTYNKPADYCNQP